MASSDELHQRAPRDRRVPTHGQAWTGEVSWMRLRQSQARAILRNPTYTGAYVSGRYRSERVIDADGNITTRSVQLPPEQWEVTIHDRNRAYISWDTYTANQRQLAANRSEQGARPPREGLALLQGVVLCGHCGTGMGVYYSSANTAHYRWRSRLDQTHTPGCRSVSAALVDPIVQARLLEIVTPDQIALAVAAAGELHQRDTRALRAFELRLERARYGAARAESAFHLCEPAVSEPAVSEPASRWLSELTDDLGGQMPSVVWALAARARALSRGAGGTELQARVRVRSLSGLWMVLHATTLSADYEKHTAVIVEPARPAELSPLIVHAYGLTSREREVARLMVQGLSAKQAARQLGVSADTLQDHLRSIYEKVGVHSRRELVTRVFFDHYWPRVLDGSTLGAGGWFSADNEGGRE